MGVLQTGQRQVRGMGSRILLISVCALAIGGCADTSEPTTPTSQATSTTGLTLPCQMVEGSDILLETGAPGEAPPQAAIHRFVQDRAPYLSQGKPQRRPAGDWVWIASEGEVEAGVPLDRAADRHAPGDWFRQVRWFHRPAMKSGRALQRRQRPDLPPVGRFRNWIEVLRGTLLCRWQIIVGRRPRGARSR